MDTSPSPPPTDPLPSSPKFRSTFDFALCITSFKPKKNLKPIAKTFATVILPLEIHLLTAPGRLLGFVQQLSTNVDVILLRVFEKPFFPENVILFLDHGVKLKPPNPPEDPKESLTIQHQNIPNNPQKFPPNLFPTTPIKIRVPSVNETQLPSVEGTVFKAFQKKTSPAVKIVSNQRLTCKQSSYCNNVSDQQQKARKSLLRNRPNSSKKILHKTNKLKKRKQNKKPNELSPVSDYHVINPPTFRMNPFICLAPSRL